MGRRTQAQMRRGFSLMELMTVVTLIAILAILAVPTMSRAREDRHTYEDTAEVGELIRTARARALGRGAAQLIKMTANPTSDRGTFLAFEATGPNPNGAAGSNSPVSSCRTPTNWIAVIATTPVDGVNLNGRYESDSNIRATILVSGTASTSAFICFTPSGRAYFVNGTTPNFDTVLPMLSPVEIDIKRPTGITRKVLIPPTGAARMFSQ